MAGIAQFVLRHKRFVVLLWLAVFVAGGATSSKTIDRLNFDFSLPGQDGYETSVQVLEKYGTDSDYPFLLVLTAPAGEKIDDQVAAQTYAAVATKMPQARVVDKTASGNNPIFSTSDGGAQFAYVFVPPVQGFETTVGKDLLDTFKARDRKSVV